MLSELVTFCVDVGSIPGGNFAWARIDKDGWETGEGPEALEPLHQRLVDDLLVAARITV